MALYQNNGTTRYYILLHKIYGMEWYDMKIMVLNYSKPSSTITVPFTVPFTVLNLLIIYGFSINTA